MSAERPLKLGVVPEDCARDIPVDHPLSLAYLGDAVWELYVRYHLLAHGVVKPNELQKRSVRYVSARAQAIALRQLLPMLTDEEQEVVRRGRNAKSKTTPKNTPVLDYRHSTGVEALVGYLYATDKIARLQELMGHVFAAQDGRGAEGE